MLSSGGMSSVHFSTPNGRNQPAAAFDRSSPDLCKYVTTALCLEWTASRTACFLTASPYSRLYGAPDGVPFNSHRLLPSIIMRPATNIFIFIFGLCVPRRNSNPLALEAIVKSHRTTSPSLYRNLARSREFVWLKITCDHHPCSSLGNH